MASAATVLGASGFTGGELVRRLLDHPAMTVVALGASSRAGIPLAGVNPSVTGCDLPPLEEHEDVARRRADVCFSCLPSGRLRHMLPLLDADLVVDLSDDFRAASWTYGLTELARTELSSADRVANPGCYPTAALLCLVPFARAGLIDGPVIVDALSGASGAGRDKQGYGLAELAGSAFAYGDVPHRHVAEIEQGLYRFAGMECTISFTPHLVPMARGLLVTARAPIARRFSDEESRSVLSDAYRDEPFIEVIEGWPTTKAVTGTNRAHISARVDVRSGFLIASAAIDNLGKGAAGQAIQNANVALGLDERTGLGGYGVWP